MKGTRLAPALQSKPKLRRGKKWPRSTSKTNFASWHQLRTTLNQLPRPAIDVVDVKLPAAVEDGAAQSSDARPTVAVAEGWGQQGGQLDIGHQPDLGSAVRTGPEKKQI